MQVIFRIEDSGKMEQAVSGLIELLKTKGGFHGVRTDGGLMIKGKRGWKKVCPVEPWSSPTNNLLWQAMLDKLYMEHYVFRWWAHGGMYSLYYNKPDRYWSLSYEGDQFSMHKVQNNGVIGAHILNIMLTLGGEPHLHIPESPGLAWTDVDGTKAGQRIREQQLAQQSADRQRQQAVAEQQLREQLQAQQNPLLVRLTEELIKEGKKPKKAFNQAKAQLDQAEKEARRLERIATEQQHTKQQTAPATILQKAQERVETHRQRGLPTRMASRARREERLAVEIAQWEHGLDNPAITPDLRQAIKQVIEQIVSEAKESERRRDEQYAEFLGKMLADQIDALTPKSKAQRKKDDEKKFQREQNLAKSHRLERIHWHQINEARQRQRSPLWHAKQEALATAIAA